MAALLAVQLLACEQVLQVAGYPPEATRKTPPEGIAARAVKAGAEFPAIQIASTMGELSFDRGKRHVLVFYRGAW